MSMTTEDEARIREIVREEMLGHKVAVSALEEMIAKEGPTRCLIDNERVGQLSRAFEITVSSEV